MGAERERKTVARSSLNWARVRSLLAPGRRFRGEHEYPDAAAKLTHLLSPTPLPPVPTESSSTSSPSASPTPPGPA